MGRPTETEILTQILKNQQQMMYEIVTLHYRLLKTDVTPTMLVEAQNQTINLIKEIENE